jgi:methyl-accepting chemotaxis protein WspA
MTKWTIRNRIVGSFGIVLALMIASAGVAYTRLAGIERETKSLRTDSLPGLSYSIAAQDAWSRNFLLLEEYVRQADATLEGKIELKLTSSRQELDKAISNYEPMPTTQEERRLFEAFKSAKADFIHGEEAILATAGKTGRQNERVARILETEINQAFDKGESAIEALVALNRSDTQTSTDDISNHVTSAAFAVAISLVVALIFAAVFGLNLLRAIVKPLDSLNGVVTVMSRGDFTQRVHVPARDEFGALADGFNRMTDDLTTLVGQVQQSGIQVSTSVTEIAATAKEQQATAHEIAATTTEIGATSREISATSKELVKTMSDVSRVAEHSATLAGAGQVGVTHMEETMQHVVEAAGLVNAKLATLNEKAGNISLVVTTITKVADQTNLLSLNAAIEAEKAGEYGRGFAVVATEIRRLADQTAVATYDIDQMVKAIQAAVSAGVMSMDKFSEQVRRGMQVIQEVGGQLSQVIQQVQALAPRFEAITEGMQAQATGAEQITDALTQLSEAARQTVDSLRQSNLAIDELNHVSLGLRSGVHDFTLQVA